MKNYFNHKRFGYICLIPFLLLFLCRCGWFLPAWNIHEAAGRGETDKVIHFHNQGADINKPSVGVTPLLLALKNRHIQTARYLIEQGADVNAATGRGAHVKAGYTALIEAAYHSDVEIGRLLLENGADPSIRASTGATALANVRGKGHKAFEQLILSYIPEKPAAKKRAMAALKPEPMTDDDMAYLKAGNEGIISAYEHYLAEFPSGKFRVKAQAMGDGHTI